VWWERLRRGGEVTVDEAEKVYDEMSSGVGYTRGHKKLPAWQDRDQLVTMQDLKEAGGLLADDLWRKALNRRMKPEEESYMVKVLQGGQKLTERPKIRISTMHGAKGAQADHVVILLDIAWRTLDEAKYLPDDEARTWYVAVTRAKQKLTIVRARNYQRSYEL
jgi:superfamily I DNA/RNA helicase